MLPSIIGIFSLLIHSERFACDIVTQDMTDEELIVSHRSMHRLHMPILPYPGK